MDSNSRPKRKPPAAKRKAPAEVKAVDSNSRPKRKPPAAGDSSDDEMCDSSGDEGSLAWVLGSLSLEAKEFQLPDDWLASLSLEGDAKTADAEIVVDYDTQTVKELQTICVTKGLSKTGTKDVLRARLQLHDTIGLDWSKNDISTPPPPLGRSSGPAHLLKPARSVSCA